jgi:hypothetical protein
MKLILYRPLQKWLMRAVPRYKVCRRSNRSNVHSHNLPSRGLYKERAAFVQIHIV